MNKKLPLETEEVLETRSPGAFTLFQSGRWRLGEWIKTNRRIIFLQGGNLVFAAVLDSITHVEQCEREYSFGKKTCLKVSWRKQEGESCFWLMSPDIGVWREVFAVGRPYGMITEGEIALLAKELGLESEGILWFVYRRRHATISELSAGVGAENHMIVLERIKHEINPAAEEIIGKPVLVFRQSWTDPLMGEKAEKIKFSWWLADGGVKDESFYDVIDEGDYYRVIVEAPETADVALEKHLLKVTVSEGSNLVIALPEFDFMPDVKRFYRNGVLELQVAKVNKTTTS